MNLTASEMGIQLGRYLGRQTGKLFVEPDSDDKGTIYAVALPSKNHRLTPAVSIVHQPSATAEAMELTERMVFVMHAQAQSNRDAVRLLGEFQRILWPNNRPTVHTQENHAPGIVGVPDVAGDHSVWRMIDIRQLSHPLHLSRTVEGLAQAEFSFEISAVETTTTEIEE